MSGAMSERENKGGDPPQINIREAVGDLRHHPQSIEHKGVWRIVCRDTGKQFTIWRTWAHEEGEKDSEKKPSPGTSRLLKVLHNAGSAHNGVV